MTRIQVYLNLCMSYGRFPTANITHIRSQNSTNMMIGKHEIQSFETTVFVSLFLLSFDIFVPTIVHPLLFSNKRFFPNTRKCQLQ